MVNCHIPILHYKQILSIWTALQATSLNQRENNGLMSMPSRGQRLACWVFCLFGVKEKTEGKL